MSVNAKRMRWRIHQEKYQISQGDGSQDGEIDWKSDDKSLKAHLVEKWVDLCSDFRVKGCGLGRTGWWGRRLLSISNPSSLLWLIILCVKWNSLSSKIHLSYCSDIFCCQRRGSEVHFVHMQIVVWTDELSCFCFVFLYPGNYKQVFLFNVIKLQSNVAFAVMEN